MDIRKIKKIIERLQNTEADDSFDLRARIAAQLRLLLDSLTVASLGEAPKVARIAEELERSYGSEANDVVDHLNRRANDPQQSRRSFAIGFRDNRVRVVFPHKQDPLRYEQQILANLQSGLQTFGEGSGDQLQE